MKTRGELQEDKTCLPPGPPHRRPSPDRRLADQVVEAHPAVANGIKAIVDEYEYENSDSLEVLVAHDADKLECVIQGLEYRQQGYPAAQEWADSTRAELKMPSALPLAEAAQTMPIAEWQRAYLR
ncbi:HD domain-containing protein [Streptomyces sp. NPDC048155]|uniref:HD domain-containing protein n=1 Tax=Streptomyces sp. NPDC048155 TaxID=3154818 RepID=UPI00340862FD